MYVSGMIWRRDFSLLWGVAREIVPVYRECGGRASARGMPPGHLPTRYSDHVSDRR
jgi:hypothetical protein